MKHLLSLLLISFALLSCSKSNEEQQQQNGNKTTVNFTNSLSYNLTNVVLGTIKTGPAILLKNIGTINAGSSTGQVEITDNTINKVFIYYDYAGKTYYTDYGFAIAQGTFNNWTIGTNTNVAQIDKSSSIYPK